MRPRVLKLGTRRSALARAQSSGVARELEAMHPGLAVELVGIETSGDRIQDRPLSTVQGKEFFTAEIDAALLEGKVDFTVHSYKDLSLERPPRLKLAAVPKRQQPHDIVVFAADVPQRLAGGFELAIGTSSPRRMSFVPDFLKRMLPRSRQCHARRHTPGGPARQRRFAAAPPARAARLGASTGWHRAGLCRPGAAVGRRAGPRSARAAVRAAAAHGAAPVRLPGCARAGRTRLSNAAMRM